MGTNSTKCVKEYSREHDRVLDDHPLEGELPTQDQAAPPTRPDINAQETTGATPEGTGPGAQALDQMAPKIIEHEANICIPPSGDQSLQDVSYEEEGTISLPLGLSSRDKVTYRPPANHAGGDSATQEVYVIGMEPEKIKDEEGEILSRPKSLSSKEDEDRSFDPSLQDVSYEEEGTISLLLSLSSLNDKVTYRAPANNAGGDSATQEVYVMGMEREKLRYDEGEDILSRPKSLSSNENEARARAPDELSQVTKRSISNKIDQIKKRIVSQSVRMNNYWLKYYEMFKSMNLLIKDNSNIKIDVVSLKSQNYERKRESAENKRDISEIKREMSEIMRENSEIKRENSEIKREYMYSEIKRENSALKSENVQLKLEMSKLKQAHHNDPIDREAMRNDTTSLQKEVMSSKAALNASVSQDDDMVHDDTVGYPGGIGTLEEYIDHNGGEYVKRDPYSTSHAF